MNLSHTVKVVGSVVLSAVMAGSMMPVTVFAQSNDENPTEKTETVYSVLNSDGSISDTIVSSWLHDEDGICLLYTSPSPRDRQKSRMPSSA